MVELPTAEEHARAAITGAMAILGKSTPGLGPYYGSAAGHYINEMLAHPETAARLSDGLLADLLRADSVHDFMSQLYEAAGLEPEAVRQL